MSSTTVTVYGTRPRRDTVEAAISRICRVHDLIRRDQPVRHGLPRVVLSSGDIRLRIEPTVRLAAGDVVSKQRVGMRDWISKVPIKDPARRAALIGLAARVQIMVTVRASPMFIPTMGHWELIYRIADALHGFVYTGDRIVSPESRILTNAEGESDPVAFVSPDWAPHVITAPVDREVRKAESIDILVRAGVPHLPTLPAYPMLFQTDERALQEVVSRALSLVPVCTKGEGLPQVTVDRLVSRLDVAEDLSPAERAFVDDRIPAEESRARFSSRFEALWTLHWALGFVDELAWPDAPCNARRALEMGLRNPNRYWHDATLRDPEELLDEADLMYRLHWAARDAALRRRPAPAGLDLGIIAERRRTLDWLVGRRDQAWDDIVLDT